MTLLCNSYITLLVKERKLNVRVLIVSILVTHIKPQGGSRRENFLYFKIKKKREKKACFLFREMAQAGDIFHLLISHTFFSLAS